MSYAPAQFSTFRPAGEVVVGRPGFATAPGGGSTVFVAGIDGRLWEQVLASGGTAGPWRALTSGGFTCAAGAATIGR